MLYEVITESDAGRTAPALAEELKSELSEGADSSGPKPRKAPMIGAGPGTKIQGRARKGDGFTVNTANRVLGVLVFLV